MSVSAPGLPALIGGLHDLAAYVSDTDVPDREASSLLAAAMKARARRRTGYLANTITPGGRGVEVLAHYAPFVEARHPFAGPAAATTDITPPYLQHLDNAPAANLRTRY